MVAHNDCGKGIPPWLGPRDGELDPPTPCCFHPKPPQDERPPFIPEKPKTPTGVPLENWACVYVDTPLTPAPPGHEYINPPFKACVPCDGQGNPAIPGGFNPVHGGPDCVYDSLAACEADCTNETQLIPTIGSVPRWACVYVNTPLTPAPEGHEYIPPFKACVPCDGGQNINMPGGVNPDPGDADCVYASKAECEADCINETEPIPTIGTFVGEVGSVGGGNIVTTVLTESNSIQQDQNTNNATIVSVNGLIEEEDYQYIQRGISQPRLFDPDFNFFKDEPNSEIELVFSYSNSQIFNREVVREVGELLRVQNTNESWDEVTLQNLSDEKLLRSLNPRLINYFQYLRYPGGELVGVSVLLNVIRKHILEGTIDEFDIDYLRGIAESQYGQNFEILKRPVGSEYSDRFAISYIKSKLHTFENTKSSPWRNFQVNRMRPLNEDVNIEIQITTLDGTVTDLSIPNEGIAIDKITYLPPVKVPSVGRPDKLNIGNGGGYYVHGETLQSVGVPIITKNVIFNSYYAPGAIRMKVLGMLGIDPSITLTASSLSGNHEFASGDVGASAIKPLFFSINLSSVSGDYVSDSLVENYNATYSLLTASSDIQVHMNNNALNTPMVSIDYRDPLYRYILDTSSFTISLNDFNLNGFKDKGLSSIGSRFVRNIPFGIIITPVAGGKYNPFNGRSNLVSYGDTHARSLGLLPATNDTIDGYHAPLFPSYTLRDVDGVDRVGIAEKEHSQNIGYSYDESNFTQTFYSASSNDYGYSSLPASSYGTSYMLKEVIDYLSDTYSTKELTWYDVFSRMPVTKVGEMFYDANSNLLLDIANGLRNNVKIQNIESGYNSVSRTIPEDSKTVVAVQDRRNITTSRL